MYPPLRALSGRLADCLPNIADHDIIPQIVSKEKCFSKIRKTAPCRTVLFSF